MKQAAIYVNDNFCGILTEDEEGFHFSYDATYLVRPNAVPLSPTMPLTDRQYDKEMMFPVFDGLIPEGWLLDIASSSWKIDPRDRMSLLLACCKDCIGNISVKPLGDYE
ncbi:MAG: HipA N-terminal domain-containing protein [Prevotella sp.]|nr:HipA N-terminal domain-containing protein [Prevotella sp.]